MIFGEKKKRKKIINWSQLAIIVGIVIMIMVLIVNAYKISAPAKQDMSYTTFKNMVDENKIENVYIVNNEETFIAIDKNGNSFNIINPKYDQFRKDLLDAGVNIVVRKASLDTAIINVLSSLPMLIITFIVLWLVVRHMYNTTATIFKLYKAEDVVKFDAIAGMSDIKEEVKFAVETLKNHKKLAELGARPTKGIILEGPPGNGKTLIAKAIAGEAGVPFISTSGSDFVEMFVGLGAARVRALWDIALNNAPCVIFIDEIDAVGRRRNSNPSNLESNQTLNALLQRMDGLGDRSGIIVIAATNLISDLDPALLRPGRFDKKLYIGPATTKQDRDEIVALYLSSKQTEDDVSVDKVSKLMFGFTGAEIENSLNESVLVSLQRGGNGRISLKDIDDATMKLRANGVIVNYTSDEDKRIAAVHEAGHAVANQILGKKVSKVSIVPYSSGVGGMTIVDTDEIENKKFRSQQDIKDSIMILLAGMVAEELILGQTTNGCSNDIQIATELAFCMVNDYAMDSKLANANILKQKGLDVQNNTLAVDVNNILSNCKDSIKHKMINHIDDINSLVEQLLYSETILNYSLRIEGDK